MANPSNLYAEKIFSEHPLALWALDQTVDYISLFDLDYQDIQEFWTVSGATASLETSDVDAPFSTVEVNKLLGTVPAGATADIVCISPVPCVPAVISFAFKDLICAQLCCLLDIAPP